MIEVEIYAFRSALKLRNIIACSYLAAGNFAVLVVILVILTVNLENRVVVLANAVDSLICLAVSCYLNYLDGWSVSFGRRFKNAEYVKLRNLADPFNISALAALSENKVVAVRVIGHHHLSVITGLVQEVNAGT